MWTLLDKNSNQLWILIYFKDNFKGCHKWKICLMISYYCIICIDMSWLLRLSDQVTLYVFPESKPSKPTIFNIHLWKVHSSLYVTWWLKPGTKGCHQVFPIVYIVQCNTGGRSRISCLRSGSCFQTYHIYI